MMINVYDLSEINTWMKWYFNGPINRNEGPVVTVVVLAAVTGLYFVIYSCLQMALYAWTPFLFQSYSSLG